MEKSISNYTSQLYFSSPFGSIMVRWRYISLYQWILLYSKNQTKWTRSNFTHQKSVLWNKQHTVVKHDTLSIFSISDFNMVLLHSMFWQHQAWVWNNSNNNSNIYYYSFILSIVVTQEDAHDIKISLYGMRLDINGHSI